MCIKYKVNIMAVQPLNKRKITKKLTSKIRRFQSDEYAKVKVSFIPSFGQILHQILAAHANQLASNPQAVRHKKLIC